MLILSNLYLITKLPLNGFPKSINSLIADLKKASKQAVVAIGMYFKSSLL